MPKLLVKISEHDLDADLARALRVVLTKIGTTSKARAQQIIGEEITDRSGKLHASIGFEINNGSGGIQLELFSEGAEPYALFQHEGTGIYGPNKAPIKPKRGKFLVWKDADTGDLIFAKEVRGTPGKKFLTRAMDFALKRILK